MKSPKSEIMKKTILPRSIHHQFGEVIRPSRYIIRRKVKSWFMTAKEKKVEKEEEDYLFLQKKI